MNATNLKRAGLFVLLTFVLSWGLAFAAFAWVPHATSPGRFTLIALAYMFTPMISAILLQKFLVRRPLRDLGISFNLNRWFLVAWLLPAVLAVLALGAGLLVPGVEWSWGMEGLFERFAKTLTPEQLARMQEQTAALPIHPLWLGLVQGLLAGATINAVAGFGEELGWRGFLQRDLEGFGFWRMSLVIGLIWGVWHLPIILQGHNYPEHPREGVFFMTYFTLLYAPLFSYVRAKAKSVIAAAVMHGTLNATVGVSFLTLRGGSDLTVGMTGLAGLGVLLLANVGLYGYDRWFERGARVVTCVPPSAAAGEETGT